jgi:hypothetical protein
MIKNKQSRSGQALVMGIFALLPMCMFMMMIFNNSLVVKQKRNLQIAADSGVASGAIVQADMISSMAWINYALADIYTQGTRTAVNLAVAATLAELESDGIAAGYPAPASLNLSGRITQFDEAWNIALEDIDPTPLDITDPESGARGRSIQWQERLSAMQYNIGTLAANLIKRQIWRTTMTNLGEEDGKSEDGRVHINLFPYHGSYVPKGDGSESWLIQMISPKGFNMQLKNSDAEVQLIINELGTDHIRYDLLVNDGKGNEEAHVIEFLPDGHIIINADTNIYWDDSIPAWVINGEAQIGEGPNGGTTVTNNGNTVELRNNPQTGGLEQWNGSDWEPVAQSYTLPSGVEIPVTSGQITLGGMNFNVGNNNVSVSLGSFSVNFAPDGSNVNMSGSISPLSSLTFNYPDGDPRLNGRWRVPQDASGQWEIFDTRQERLTPSDGDFIFEVATLGDYVMEDTNGERFAIDQGQAIFGDLFETGFADETWMYDGRLGAGSPGWYEVAQGQVAFSKDYDHENHYHQTVDGCWHGLDQVCPLLAHAAGCTGLEDIIMNGPTPPATYLFAGEQVDGGWHENQSHTNEDGSTINWVEWVPCPLCSENGAGFSTLQGLQVVSDDATFYAPNPGVGNTPQGYLLDVFELQPQGAIKKGYKVVMKRAGGRQTVRYMVDYIGDDKTDVRRYPDSNVFRNANHEISNSSMRYLMYPRVTGDDVLNQENANYRRLRLWNMTVPTRLVLTEDFFKWGINIAVHNNDNPHDKFMLSKLFTDHKFSPIVTASAKVGFVDPVTNKIHFRWPTTAETIVWVDNSPDNLMVTEWVAKMISTREPYTLEDLAFLEEDTFLVNPPLGADKPSISLLKHYLQRNSGQWRHVYDISSSSGSYDSARNGRNRKGERWDLDDVELDLWIKH